MNAHFIKNKFKTIRKDYSQFFYSENYVEKLFNTFNQINI